MKRFSVIVAIAVCAVTACLLASRQETSAEIKTSFRLGVINSRDVLTKCDQGAQLIRDIQGKFAQRRAQLESLDQEIRKLQDELKLSGGEQAKKELLQDKLRTFADEEQHLFQEVSQEENQRFAPLVELVNKTLTAYAKEKGISAIQEQGAFVFIDPGLDITGDIIKRVNLAKN
jgi:outer membrane protein